MLLLDTHAYYWFITDDDKLPLPVKELIETERYVFVSIASFWEMAIKSSLGKLVLPASIAELMASCTECGFVILPISPSHIECLTQLPYIHRDPFDRMLVCQAKTDGLTLVTVDQHIMEYDVPNIWII